MELRERESLRYFYCVEGVLIYHHAHTIRLHDA